jgi:hypothetical protein
MKFVLKSLTYHNCPVTEREKAAFTADQNCLNEPPCYLTDNEIK